VRRFFLKVRSKRESNEFHTEVGFRTIELLFVSKFSATFPSGWADAKMNMRYDGRHRSSACNRRINSAKHTPQPLARVQMSDTSRDTEAAPLADVQLQ
jgi:hypothetical protein